MLLKRKRLGHDRHMRFRSFTLGVLLLALSLTTSTASVRIADDRGGQIGAYIDTFKKMRDAGQNVIIDGDCVSACTLVLGLIPHDRICVTPRARFGFHSAWKPWFIGIHLENAAGTHILWNMYPDQIRDWIVSKGGLSDRILYLSGADLTALYPQCR